MGIQTTNRFWRWAKRQRILIAGITAGLVVGSTASAVVMASIPDSSGVIHACYTTGLLARVRIIDTATASCNANETAISWNQTGPQGPAGPSGAGAFGSYVSMAGADLGQQPGVDLSFHNFTNGDFSNSKLGDRPRLSYSDFTNANFSGANMEVTAEHANFTNANFNGANMINGGYIRLSNFANANMSNQHISMILDGSTFASTNLSNTFFDFASLKNANLSTAVLTGTTWHATICPDNTNSDANGNTCLGHLVP